MKKTELKDRLNCLTNTVWSDIEYTQEHLVDNEIWDESAQDTVNLDRTARLALLESISNLEYIQRKLRELSEEI